MLVGQVTLTAAESAQIVASNTQLRQLNTLAFEADGAASHANRERPERECFGDYRRKHAQRLLTIKRVPLTSTAVCYYPKKV